MKSTFKKPLKSPRHIKVGYNADNLTSFRSAKEDLAAIAEHYKQLGLSAVMQDNVVRIYDTPRYRFPVVVAQLECRP